LYRNRSNATRATVDEDRLAGLDAERRRARSLVSPATPAAAATAQSIEDGFTAQAFSTAYCA
jgi:hypothetical protein